MLVRLAGEADALLAPIPEAESKGGETPEMYEKLQAAEARIKKLEARVKALEPYAGLGLAHLPTGAGAGKGEKHVRG